MKDNEEKRTKTPSEAPRKPSKSSRRRMAIISAKQSIRIQQSNLETLTVFAKQNEDSPEGKALLMSYDYERMFLGSLIGVFEMWEV